MTAPLDPRTPTTTGLTAAPTSWTTDAPQGWDPVRDPAFFRLVAHLFPPATTWGMSVLLASYDDETAATGPWSAAPRD